MIESFLSSHGITMEKLKYIGFGIAGGIIAMIITIIGLSIGLCCLKSKYKRKKARVENMSDCLYSEKRYAEFLEFQRRYDTSQLEPTVQPNVRSCSQPTNTTSQPVQPPVSSNGIQIQPPTVQVDIQSEHKLIRKSRKKNPYHYTPESVTEDVTVSAKV